MCLSPNRPFHRCRHPVEDPSMHPSPNRPFQRCGRTQLMIPPRYNDLTRTVLRLHFHYSDYALLR
uniref:CSON010232 protein n=1 Tax=Culicoides sonorensis TaxID=179676 RepID=A0A336KIM3_CULSO